MSFVNPNVRVNSNIVIVKVWTNMFPKGIKIGITFHKCILWIQWHWCVFFFPTDISSVSPVEGSLSGGTDVVIEGSYFDYTDPDLAVYIGGRLSPFSRTPLGLFYFRLV